MEGGGTQCQGFRAVSSSRRDYPYKVTGRRTADRVDFIPETGPVIWHIFSSDCKTKLHWGMGIILGLDLSKLIDSGSKQLLLFPVGSACQALVCSLQRAKDQSIQILFKKVLGKLTPDKRVELLVPSLLPATHWQCTVTFFLELLLCTSWAFWKGTIVFWEKGLKAN